MSRAFISLRWLVILLAMLSIKGSSQALPTNPNAWGLEKGETPPLQFSFQYSAMHANAPPQVCGCFWLQGFGGDGEINYNRHWGLALNLSSTSASRVNGTTENLRVFNYVVGPRFHLRNRTAFTPFAHVMVGGSEVFSNYRYYHGGYNAFAIQGGGGLDVRLAKHVSITPVEANYVFSAAPNGVNSRQNNFRVSAGVSLRFY